MKYFKLLLTVLVGFIVFASFGTEVEADTGVRYNTFTTSNGELVRTQTAYVALSSMDEIFGVSLDVPQDIFIDPSNNVYIASTDASGTAGKIIKFNLGSDQVEVFGDTFLQNPTGIFVDGDGNMYITDREAQIVYKLDDNGDEVQRFIKPTSPLYGTDEFNPRKVVVDSRGNVFVLNNGSRGLLQYTKDGEFIGYFGTNTITPTLRMVLQYIFFTDEQRANLFSPLPPEVSNVAIDDRGLIHTTSLGIEGFGVKRLNISGQNLLPEMYNELDLIDIYVGPIGNIYTISGGGIIAEYDIEGNLLFMFGGQDSSNQVKGYFNIPSAIAADDKYNLYVLDRANNELQIFIPTEFATLVHSALELYQDGRYIESKEPWEDVLKMNDLFDLAHTGLGNAYYSLEEYEDALDEYYISYDRQGYSDAFWEVRNAWLLDNIGIALVFVFAIMVAYVVNIRWRFVPIVMRPIKKGIQTARDKVKTLDEILYVFRYLRNPADATYEIKRHNRVGLLSATILLVIYFLLYIFYIYRLGFLFNFRVLADINILEEILTVFLPIVLFVLANFLIGSIRDGEGRFRDVYVTTIFSLTPFFITLPLLVLMSHGLTYNEAFLMDFLTYIAIGVTVIYFFFMVKETHYYAVKDTIASIAISFFTMVMILLGSFIVYILLSELVNLIVTIFMEVFYRV
jgi:DNA-binding beta-propeller fold protein YncE